MSGSKTKILNSNSREWGNVEDVGNRVLILDEITDPQNLGAIVRSAATFGFYDIITKDYGNLLKSPVVEKISCGGLEYVRFVPVTNITKTMNTLKDRGFWCYGLDHEGAQEINKIQYSAPIAFVLGSEGKGMRRLVRETCDALVKIPSFGEFCVLNAAQASTVAMFHYSLNGN